MLGQPTDSEFPAGVRGEAKHLLSVERDLSPVMRAQVEHVLDFGVRDR